MYVAFSYDARENILFMQAVTPVLLDSEEKLGLFYREILTRLKILPHKVYLVADISGFTVSPKVAAIHGDWIKNHILPAVLELVRYGKPTTLHEISIRTQAVQRGYEVVIHPDRDTALASLKLRNRKAATQPLRSL